MGIVGIKIERRETNNSAPEPKARPKRFFLQAKKYKAGSQNDARFFRANLRDANDKKGLSTTKPQEDALRQTEYHQQKKAAATSQRTRLKRVA